MVTRNWDKARIGVSIKYPNLEDLDNITYKTHNLVLGTRVSTDVVMNYRPLHGLNEWNQGITELPPEFTFTIACPAVSSSTRLLRSLQVTGSPFELLIYDVNDTGEFALVAETFVECRLQNRDLNVVVADVPTTVWNGLALRYTFETRNAADAKVALNELYGSGRPVYEDPYLGPVAET